MTDDLAIQLAALTRAIPRLFHLLKALGDGMHADLGVTTAMRGVMRSLAMRGPTSVPDLARERPVSRQHMQTVVDQLLLAGMAEPRLNPAHRRSSLIALTVQGEAAIQQMTRREAALIAELSPRIRLEGLAAAVEVLGEVEIELARLVEHGWEVEA